MRSIIVIEQGHAIRAYHNVTVQYGDHSDRGYMPITVVRADGNLWSQVIEQARKDLINFTKKYNGLEQYKVIIEQIEDFLKQSDDDDRK